MVRMNKKNPDNLDLSNIAEDWRALKLNYFMSIKTDKSQVESNL